MVHSERDKDSDKDSHYRMDAIWHFLSTVKGGDGCLTFSTLSKVARLVLVIAHSNADEERVFSMVRKNKTPFCPNLQLDNNSSKPANYEATCSYSGAMP